MKVAYMLNVKYYNNEVTGFILVKKKNLTVRHKHVATTFEHDKKQKKSYFPKLP
jgi:hypothetical protein